MQANALGMRPVQERANRKRYESVVGAHAQTAKLRLLTRDASRYRTYFPKVRLITPE